MCDEPYPSSHALYEPPCAAWPLSVVMTPDEAVQLTLPDSKPGLASLLPEQPPDGGVVVAVGVGVGVPPAQVGSPDWAGTLTASQAALTALNSVQLLG